MVFSLFKRDPKPAPGRLPKRGADAPAGGAAAARPSSASAWNNTRLGSERRHGAKDSERAQARENLAKINQIESEMARDLGTAAEAVATASGRATMTRTDAVADAITQGRPTRPGGDDLGVNTNTFLGRANAIEITHLGSGPVIDEAAMLFAHRQDAQAEAILRKGIAENDLGDSSRTGWHLLLELLNQRDDRAAFEQAAQQYATRFQGTAPAWHSYLPAPGQVVAGAAAPADDGPVVQLPETVDAGVVHALERLKAKATNHRDLALDASAVRSVDAVGAEMLLRVLAAFRRAPHSLRLYGAGALAAALRAAVQAGRRDPSDACWLLRLELLRIAGQSAAFDDVAIEYCLTYEVSPPAWEPAPANLTLAAGPAPVPAAPTAPATAPTGPLNWAGTIDREDDPWLAALAEQARERKDLAIDCLHLRRIGFDAASALLAHIVRLKQSGTTLRLDRLNPLVAALLTMLGVGEVAELNVRR